MNEPTPAAGMNVAPARQEARAGATPACPVCSVSFDAHTEGTAQLHYQTWRRLAETAEARATAGDIFPMPVGEYDDMRLRVVHPGSWR